MSAGPKEYWVKAVLNNEKEILTENLPLNDAFILKSTFEKEHNLIKERPDLKTIKKEYIVKVEAGRNLKE